MIDWTYEIGQLERMIEDNEQGYHHNMRAASNSMAEAERSRRYAKQAKKKLKAIRKLANG